jgi:hypothetical protein
LCCAGSFSSTIDVECDFSSKGWEWWGHDTHAYDHDWCMEWSRTSSRVSNSKRRHETNPVRVPKVEAQSNSSSSPVRSLGVLRNKTDAQITYEVGSWRSIYGWKHNFIELSMAPVSCQNSSWINGNHRNKLTSRICQCAMLPVWWALGPSCGAPS